MISKKHKNICKTLNHVEHLLILTSVITVYVYISAFASIVGVPIDFMSSKAGLKTYTLTTRIKKYKSVIRKIGKSMIK